MLSLRYLERGGALCGQFVRGQRPLGGGQRVLLASNCRRRQIAPAGRAAEQPRPLVLLHENLLNLCSNQCSRVVSGAE
jgi:hypothetical protein